MTEPVIIPVAAMERLLKVNEKTITDPLHKVLADMGHLAQATAIARAPGTSLPASIMLEVQPLMARIHTPLKQARTIEGGRKPGAKAPPGDQLEAYYGGDIQTSTYVIAQAIAKRGFKGRFFMRKARAAVNKALPARLNEMVREIEVKFGK